MSSFVSSLVSSNCLKTMFSNNVFSTGDSLSKSGNRLGNIFSSVIFSDILVCIPSCCAVGCRTVAVLFEVLFEIVPSVVVVDDVETDVCVLFVGIEVCGCVRFILAIALSISSTTA